MADATGSSAGTGPRPDPGAAAGHGDLGRGITQEQYQAFLTSSMNRIAPSAVNIYPQTQQHHYPIGLIPAPVGMPMPERRAVYSSQIVVPPQQLAPPPQYRVVQSQPPAPLAGGRYQQDYPAYGNTTSSTSPSLGFSGWRMYGNALMSFAHQTPFGSISGNINNGNISLNSSGFQQNSSPFSTTMWTSYVQTNQPYCTNYGAATNDPALQQAPSFHMNNNNQLERDNIGYAANFAAAAPLVSGSPFEVTSQRPTNCSSAQIFQEVKNLDGTLRASGSVEIDGSEASEESDPKAQNQLGQGVGDISSTDNTILNCKDYRAILRKDLTNSDCGNIGRIVLPKRDAEANLPALVDKDGLILEMDDLELPDVWKFKYRYWPNNKSRMYILETAGEFVKKHNLEAGDVFIIYQHKRTGKHVARAVKAYHLSSTMTVLECQCLEEGNNGQECGFIVHPPTRKT